MASYTYFNFKERFEPLIHSFNDEVINFCYSIRKAICKDIVDNKGDLRYTPTEDNNGLFSTVLLSANFRDNAIVDTITLTPYIDGTFDLLYPDGVQAKISAKSFFEEEKSNGIDKLKAFFIASKPSVV